MPSDNRNELTDSAALALAHLGMLVQIANGSHRPQPGEIDKRAAALGAYIRTGQLLASDEDRELIAVIKGFPFSQAPVPIEALG
jgi:hypothetical protein